MKRSSITILLAILMSMVNTEIYADSAIKVANDDGVIIRYNWENNKTGVYVTWLGNSKYDNSIKYSGNIVIPESVEYEGVSYPVTSIGEAAFNNCSNLESVTIPNSEKAIYNTAFVGCSSLTSITIPNSVTSIGTAAFQDCSSLNSLIIGNCVATIGYDAFRSCTSLTSAIIPSSVTSITGPIFIGCDNLSKLEFHNNTLGRGNGTVIFSDLPSLT